MKVAFIPIIIGTIDTVTKKSIKGLENLEIRGRVETIQYCINDIGQNTGKSLGDLRRLVTQTSVKNH